MIYNLKVQANLLDAFKRICPESGLSEDEMMKVMQDYFEARMLDQPWVKEWLEEPLEPDQESIEWMRSRPDSIKALMVRFPPSCLVRANRPLHIPAPDSVGIVQSYYENGELGVIQGPDVLVPIRAQCKAEWLELVACRPPVDREWVNEILGEWVKPDDQ